MKSASQDNRPESVDDLSEEREIILSERERMKPISPSLSGLLTEGGRSWESEEFRLIPDLPEWKDQQKSGYSPLGVS